MGLALCKKIVEHHGGTIRIDTSYTDGTRFEFTLPITEPLLEPIGTPMGSDVIRLAPVEGANK